MGRTRARSPIRSAVSSISTAPPRTNWSRKFDAPSTVFSRSGRPERHDRPARAACPPRPSARTLAVAHVSERRASRRRDPADVRAVGRAAQRPASHTARPAYRTCRRQRHHPIQGRGCRQLRASQRCSARGRSRTRERAERLVRRFTLSATVVASAEDAVVGASVVVNATPIGRRADDPVPFPLTALARGAAVLDLTYGMNETALVRDARAHGHPAMDGLLMLVEQGATSFERWFNVTADRAEMWAALGRDAMMT